MNKINEVKSFLDNKGIKSELRTDRVDGPYICIGDEKHVRNRIQFWDPGDANQVDMYVGKEMPWYEKSKESPYLDSNYRYSDKENKISFPNVDMVKEFVDGV